MGIRVLLVDDQTLARMGLRSMLRDVPEIEIVGEAENGQATLAMARETRPDVVLMDLKMADGDGIEATRLIRQQLPGVRVLIVSAYGDAGLFRRAAAAGASGYVLKDVSSGDLAAAIRAVYHGRTMINPAMGGQSDGAAPGNGGNTAPSASGAYGLTDREIQVLAEVALGLSDKEIGAKLFLSKSTIKSHLRAMYRKLHVRNRAQAVAFAIEHQILEGWLALTPPHAGRWPKRSQG